MFKEHDDYRKLITKKADEYRKTGLSEEYLPKAMFEPKMLMIREKKGANPIHIDMLWGSKLDCGPEDINFLIEHI